MLRLIAQVKPAAITLTDAYTTPYASGADQIRLSGAAMTLLDVRRKEPVVCILRALWVCNTSATDSFRMQIAMGGAASGLSLYLYYEQPLPYPGTFIDDDLDFPLIASDVVRFYCTGGTGTFHLIGDELI